MRHPREGPRPTWRAPLAPPMRDRSRHMRVKLPNPPPIAHRQPQVTPHCLGRASRALPRPRKGWTRPWTCRRSCYAEPSANSDTLRIALRCPFTCRPTACARRNVHAFCPFFFALPLIYFVPCFPLQPYCTIRIFHGHGPGRATSFWPSSSAASCSAPIKRWAPLRDAGCPSWASSWPPSRCLRSRAPLCTTFRNARTSTATAPLSPPTPLLPPRRSSRLASTSRSLLLSRSLPLVHFASTNIVIVCIPSSFPLFFLLSFLFISSCFHLSHLFLAVPSRSLFSSASLLPFTPHVLD